MSQKSEFEIENEFEQELEEESAVSLDSEGFSRLNPVRDSATDEEWELAPVYPQPLRHNVPGFSRYSNSVPAAQHTKLRNIATLIVRSFGPGRRPIRTVRLIGHADRDLARERREPGFMRKISRQRAIATKYALQRLINHQGISARIRWYVHGAAANRMVVPNPRTESERAQNRRVEISLSTEGDCSGWEKDPQSFSKRAVEHYLRNIWKPSFRVRSIVCGVPPPEWMCNVAVDAGDRLIDLTVKLSPADKLVRVERIPDPNTHMVCLYGYRCLSSGALVLESRTCPTF